MINTASIKTTLLTGFLGAGKTTYLNQLLQSDMSAGSMVLVNDFGQINIDASLITYRDESVVRLNNGCVCCTLGASMAEKLAEIGRLEPAPSSLYIELSGVANAGRVADMIRVAQRFDLTEVRCFVDVSMAQFLSEDERVKGVWGQQIQAATHIVLNRLKNKQDIPIALSRILSRCIAQVDLELMSDESPPSYIEQKNELCVQQGTGWHSISVTLESPVSLSGLELLLVEFAPFIYRAKGLIKTQEGRNVVVQWTKSQLQITNHFKALPLSQIVFIGTESEQMERLKARVAGL